METVSIFMIGNEAPAATTRGINGYEEYDRQESRLAHRALPVSVKRPDQPRCCGNPSWDKGQRASTAAGRTAPFKSRASSADIDSLYESIDCMDRRGWHRRQLRP